MHLLSRNFFITSFALIAFAANSVICRLALGEEVIDPARFTAIRLISGAVVLAIIVNFQAEGSGKVYQRMNARVWLAPLMLFAYAITFSFAYTKLNTATGALILFGTVQLCLIGSNIVKGQHLCLQEWFGVITAFSGFALLMLPSVSRPSLTGFVLMALAGIAWAVYTLEGKKSKAPTFDTAKNFLLSVPLAVLLFIFSDHSSLITLRGILLALVSGVVASGIGYVIWYMALKDLSVTQAAVAQLAVPAIAAVGGVVFVAELMTLSLAISMILVLGGIALVTFVGAVNRNSK